MLLFFWCSLIFFPVRINSQIWIIFDVRFSEGIITAFKRSKPELSGFPGFHSITLSLLPSPCIDKSQQRDNSIIISLSRSDQAFKIHWTICFNRGRCILPPLVCVWGPSSSYWSYISLSWSFIGLFHDTPATWICPVAPPGMTTRSISPLVSNSFTLWTRWPLKLPHANNLLLIFPVYDCILIHATIYGWFDVATIFNCRIFYHILSNFINFTFISWKDN